MASTVLVDTAFLVASLDPRDSWHDRALGLAAELERANATMVLTDAVLLELANYFARGPLRGEAIGWIGAIRGAAGWEVVPLSRPAVARGEARYREHGDKTWSLTDCISMEVMLDRGITEVATTDIHFEQAGFRALLRGS